MLLMCVYFLSIFDRAPAKTRGGRGTSAKGKKGKKSTVTTVASEQDISTETVWEKDQHPDENAEESADPNEQGVVDDDNEQESMDVSISVGATEVTQTDSSAPRSGKPKIVRNQSQQSQESTAVQEPVAERKSFYGFSALRRMCANCENYAELEKLVREHNSSLPPINFDLHVNHRLDWDRHDSLAFQMMPIAETAKGNFYPVLTTPSRNAFHRCVSRFLYGHEGQYVEVRVRIIFEGVMNAKRYLDNKVLRDGCVAGPCDLRVLYCQEISPTTRVDELSKNRIVQIFQQQHLNYAKWPGKPTYWQLHMAANVTAMVLYTWFPRIESEIPGEEMEENKRDLLQRSYRPFGILRPVTLGIILYTKSSCEGILLDHFVPIVR
jgi:hypothetical protein